MPLEIKKLTSTAKLPTKAYPSDLGYDLYSDEDVELSFPEVKKIKTGICIGFPKGWGGFIKDRSSMASKGFTVSGGVIDHEYTGEISVLISFMHPNIYERMSPSTPRKINKGDKIAQLVLIPVSDFQVVEVSELGDTSRGSNGFGSSGNV